MNPNKPTTIDEYIAEFPQETQVILQQVRAIFKKQLQMQKKRSVTPFQHSL
jgi:hypothetical protein